VTEEVDMAMLARKLRSLRPEQVVKVDVEHADEDREEARLSRRWSLGLVLAWAFIFSTSVAVEPPPAHPNAPEPLAAVLLGTALLGAWALMAVGLLGRHPTGAKASFVAGVLLLAGAIACPVTGHHQSIGLWWFYELAGAATLMALSLLALPRRSAARQQNAEE
jgi:peptidoglycan/LPS O-acetylase OafA/YrhL